MRSALLCLGMIAAGCASKHDETHADLSAVAACTAKDLGCPRPILYVSRLDKSITYYKDKLGFRFDWTDGSPPDFGAVSRGDVQLFMCQKCQGHAGGWVWVTTPDVDALYAELVKRGAIIKAKPENKPWRVREMQVADPDGNVLRIGSPVR